MTGIFGLMETSAEKFCWLTSKVTPIPKRLELYGLNNRRYKRTDAQLAIVMEESLVASTHNPLSPRRKARPSFNLRLIFKDQKIVAGSSVKNRSVDELKTW